MLIIRISIKIERFTRVLRNNNSHLTLKKFLYYFLLCFLQKQEVFTKTNEYFEKDVKKIRYY